MSIEILKTKSLKNIKLNIKIMNCSLHVLKTHILEFIKYPITQRYTVYYFVQHSGDVVRITFV